MELLKQHECADCKKILHIVCAEWDRALEKHVCFPCMSRRSSAPAAAPVSDVPSPDYSPPDLSFKEYTLVSPPETSAGPAPLMAGVVVCDDVTRAVQKKTAVKGKIAKFCKACGGTDHQRRSSLLCSKNPKI